MTPMPPLFDEHGCLVRAVTPTDIENARYNDPILNCCMTMYEKGELDYDHAIECALLMHIKRSQRLYEELVNISMQNPAPLIVGKQL